MKSIIKLIVAYYLLRFIFSNNYEMDDLVSDIRAKIKSL